MDVSLRSGNLDLECVTRCSQGMSPEAAEMVGRRVALALFRGTEEVALDAVKEAWATHLAEIELPCGPALFDEPLARVLDDLRALNVLENELGILTIGDLITQIEMGLPEIANVGTVTRGKINDLAVTMRLRAKPSKPA